jgi:enoyl-[acyl-carrier protein] reductase II
MALVPQVVDAIKIPVIAAGGIADGRGIAAAFMLGAEGVQVGTRFLASTECQIHENYKSMVIEAGDTDTSVTGRSNGHPVRALKNKLTKKFLSMEKEGATFEELEALTVGSLRKAVKEGDVDEGSFMAGQIAGLIKDIKPCQDIMEEMFAHAESLIRDINRYGRVTVE